jgi:hypothetical protein
MEVWLWILEHWLDLLQSVGIIAGLLFTVHTIRTDARSRRIANHLIFSGQYRDIWKQTYVRPELARVFELDVDLVRAPVTNEERLFARLLILHLDGIHRAMKEKMFASLSGLQKDVRMSFERPVLRAVWEEVKEFQDPDFVAFVEMNRR